MKTKTYKHLGLPERAAIGYLLEKNYSLRAIAQALKRGLGTISEEIRRNKTKGAYGPFEAERKSKLRRADSKYQGMKVRGSSQLEEYVIDKLKNDWSPELIAGRLKGIDTYLPEAGKDAIYKYIKSVWGVSLRKHLAYQGKSRSKLKQASQRKLEDRRFIEDRPQITSKRERFGDWEGDFIVSGKNGSGVLLVLYERKSRYVLIKKIMSQKTAAVNAAIKEMTQGLTHFKSLTLDNDISFAKHEELSKILKAPIFFCHPYHSWEKGGVENANKLIRRYLPKGTGFSKVNEERIKRVEIKLNTRPRKCLGYKTPLEVMLENNQFKKLPLSINSKQKQACSA